MLKYIQLTLALLMTCGFTIESHGAEAIHFKPAEMIVTSPEEWESYGIDIPELTEALLAYHKTQPYQQDVREFLLQPNKYFNTRLQALINLINAIPPDATSPPLVSLLQKAKNKELYILALPDMQDPRCSCCEESFYSKKDLIVRDAYWAEFLDPLHRAGDKMSLYKQLWKTSHIPNYFIYLETIENDPLFRKYLPQDLQVQYFHTEEERAPHRLTFKKGVAYQGDKLFDTSEFETEFSGKGYGIFVLGTDGEFYVNNYHRYQLHHSSEFAGLPVVSAGEIMAKKGKILAINNKSGHYSPTLESVLTTLKSLEDKLKTIKGIMANVIFAKSSSGMPIRVKYEAQSLLAKRGELLSTSAQYRWTPLHVAVWRDQFFLAKEACNLCNIDAQNEPGLTALHLAAQLGSLEWLQFLLDKDADTTLLSREGLTALHVAALAGNIDSMDLLYKYSRPLKKTASGETLLHLAIQSGNPEAYHYLRSKKFKNKKLDQKGNGPLYFAVASKNLEMVLLQLSESKGEELFARNKKGETLLHAAAAFGTPEIFNFLIEQGLDPLLVNDEGNTVMHRAAQYENGAMMKFLLNNEFASMLYAKNNSGLTPLHYSGAFLSPVEFEEVLAHAYTVDVRDNLGNTPLLYAIQNGNIRNLLLLLRQGADIHERNNAGDAPIHASASSSFMTIDALLCHSDDIDLCDGQGNTPLQRALMHRNIDCARYLIPYSSIEMIFHENRAGLNALDLAKRLKDASLLEKLREKIIHS